MNKEQKASMQALFNKACQAVIQQGCQSYSASLASCMYRLNLQSGTALKCAIGHVLTDEQIIRHNIQEGSSPNSFTTQLLAELFPNADLSSAAKENRMRAFLVALQGAHDHCMKSNFTKDFKDRANLVALDWGLDPIG